MPVFAVINDETLQMCVISPIIYHNLKKQLENRGLFLFCWCFFLFCFFSGLFFFFNLTYKVTKRHRHWHNSWLAFFENLTKSIYLTHLDVFNGLSG